MAYGHGKMDGVDRGMERWFVGWCDRTKEDGREGGRDSDGVR